jgi:hypothetical protein
LYPESIVFETIASLPGFGMVPEETIANIPGCGMAPERYVSSSPDPNM